MTIEARKEKLVLLGKFLGQFTLKDPKRLENLPGNEPYFEILNQQIETSVNHNGWFTKKNIVFALQQWSASLSTDKVDTWLSRYNFEETTPKTVGVIMAGNIPLVGLHDFLSVLVSGHGILVKQSSHDKQLLPVIANYLKAIAPEWDNKISFITSNAPPGGGRMKDVAAVIATGSNNTARYFEYYFKNKPSIIRKNRNSVAVLTGKETLEKLALLGEDIFRYFGLGCRNVSKLFVPENYDFTTFFEAIFPWNDLINHAKYANNYDYNKAVYLMSDFKLLENGFLILKEDSGFGSPIATLFYEYYKSETALKNQLNIQEEQIQAIVSEGLFNDEISFGGTQSPNLWDYADGVDTLEFLQRL